MRNSPRRKVRAQYEIRVLRLSRQKPNDVLDAPSLEPETPNGSSPYSGLKSLSIKSKHEDFSQVVAPRALECSRHNVPFVIVPMALRMSASVERPHENVAASLAESLGMSWTSAVVDDAENDVARSTVVVRTRKPRDRWCRKRRRRRRRRPAAATAASAAGSAANHPPAHLRLRCPRPLNESADGPICGGGDGGGAIGGGGAGARATSTFLAASHSTQPGSALVTARRRAGPC